MNTRKGARQSFRPPGKATKRALPVGETVENEFEVESIPSDSDEELEVDLPKRVKFDPSMEEEVSTDDDDDDDEQFEGLDPRSFVISDSRKKFPRGAVKDDYDDESDDDSDEEMQIAIDAGLVDSEQPMRQRKLPVPINKVDEIKARLASIPVEENWLASVDVVAAANLVFDKHVDDDFDREGLFYKQAVDGAQKAVEKLRSLDAPVFRPVDYFAEMEKSDKHMQRVRNILLKRQKEAERRDSVRRVRAEKKFAVKVQKETEEQKSKEKRQFHDAVKKHKKGMKGQLEAMLNNAQSMLADDADDMPAKKGRKGAPGKGKMNRTSRNQKFGLGGRKRGWKRNTAESVNDIGRKAGKRANMGRPKGGKGGRKKR